MAAKRIDPVALYREYAWFQFSMDGEGLGLRQARDALGQDDARSDDVRKLDIVVVEAAQVNEYINPVLLEDDPAQPIASWWWHLGKLRNRTYPAHLLPEHLRVIYEQAHDEAA